MNTLGFVPLPSGDKMAALGQGTWHFAESPARRAEEIASIRLGIDLGMTVIDTAEMYGNGGGEVLSAEPIPGRRRKYSWSTKCSHTTQPGQVPFARARQAWTGLALTTLISTFCTGGDASRWRRRSRASPT